MADTLHRSDSISTPLGVNGAWQGRESRDRRFRPRADDPFVAKDRPNAAPPDPPALLASRGPTRCSGRPPCTLLWNSG